MAERHRLKTSQIGSKSRKPGLLHDGGGLYLNTSKTFTQSWIYRYRKRGKLNDIGLGSTQDVSLAAARQLADDARKAIKAGRNPKAAIRGESSGMTFKSAAENYILTHSPAWRNEKHVSQWENTLQTYAFPKIGAKPVAEINTDDVLAVLSPIWGKKTETASRVRMRIEKVLAWATAKGHREGFNPAIWRGHLNQLLPPREKVQKRKHFAALPYSDIPDLYADLVGKDALSAKALRFTMLTVCRTGEVIGARWREINDDLWTIPASRMKADKAHRVPLSASALALLEELSEASPFLFPGGGESGHISNIAMLKLLKSMHPDITVHGLRSSFRDWAAEQTNYQNHIAEMALAHTVSSAVEAAYRRGDLLPKRRDLMNDWAAYCCSVRPQGHPRGRRHG